MLDNYDSFTYNLKDYLEQLHHEVRVVRNDELSIKELETLDMKGIVISPGPKRPESAGITMEVIQRFEKELPILGVCLGHQAIGLHFGANLGRTPKPVHGKTSTISGNAHPMFEGIKDPVKVCRYHSLTLEDIQNPLEIISKSKDDCVMAISHKTLPIWGVQFHPEAILSEGGLQLIANWLKLVES